MAAPGLIYFGGKSYDVVGLAGVVFGAAGATTHFLRKEVSLPRDEVLEMEKAARNERMRVEKRAQNDVKVLRKNALQDAKHARAEVNLAREEFRDLRIEAEAWVERVVTKAFASLAEEMREARRA